jgi:hypothetical protein
VVALRSRPATLAQRNGAGGEPLCQGVELGTSGTARMEKPGVGTTPLRVEESVWRRAWGGGRRVAAWGLGPRASSQDAGRVGGSELGIGDAKAIVRWTGGGAR